MPERQAGTQAEMQTGMPAVLEIVKEITNSKLTTYILELMFSLIEVICCTQRHVDFNSFRSPAAFFGEYYMFFIILSINVMIMIALLCCLCLLFEITF